MKQRKKLSNTILDPIHLIQFITFLIRSLNYLQLPYSFNQHIPEFLRNITVKYFRMPKSQLQFKVLNSYKQLLKASANRPSVQNRVRNEFRQNKSIKRMELQLIEHKLRLVHGTI